MQIPLQVTFEGTAPSDDVQALIRHEVDRLEQHNHRITGCRVSVTAPSSKHRHGTGFQIHIWLTLPPHESIVVDRTPSDERRIENVNAAIKTAFASARRQIDDRAPRLRRPLPAS